MSDVPNRRDGSGTLRPEAGGPTHSRDFFFVLTGAPGRSRPGIPPPPMKLSERGTVSAIDGRGLGEGPYRLTESSGQEIVVQKIAGVWHRLERN